MKSTYSLPLGLYDTQNEPFSLKDHNICVFVEYLNEAGKNLNHPRLNSYVGQTFQLASQKYNTLRMLENDATIDSSMFVLSYSNPDNKNIDLNKFINELKASDITKEYKSVIETLMFGYLEFNVSDTTPYSSNLKKYVQDNPYSFLFLSKIVKNGQKYHLPSDGTSDIKEIFKEIMVSKLEGFPQHQKVIEAYCEDWAKVFEKKPKPKF